jgi:hypothetical protein
VVSPGNYDAKMVAVELNALGDLTFGTAGAKDALYA